MQRKIPLLLIPGLASNRRMWVPQIEGLSDIADCWVTPLPAVDDLGVIADEILADAPDRFAVAGHSMGGYLCFEVYRRAPDRVTHMCLMSTTADPETPGAAERRRASIADIARDGFLPTIRGIIPRFVRREERNGGPVFEAMLKQAYEVGREAFCRHQRASLARTGYRDLLPAIRCPVLVVGGRHDVVTRVSSQAKMARAIPDAAFATVARSAHMVTMENPRQTNTLMRHWLIADVAALAA